MLLHKAITEKTGYNEDDARGIILGKLKEALSREEDAEEHSYGRQQYQSLIGSNGADRDSWAAITTYYQHTDAEFYASLMVRIKEEEDGDTKD